MQISQVHPEGKYVVDLDKSIDITKITPSTRVALRNDSYMLHLILPSKVDPLVNLMKVEKVPDSTYDMIGGLDQQIKEIKEVCIDFQCTVYLFYYLRYCLTTYFSGD
jgi:26S proteasome regulatory subunit T6